MAGIGDAEGGEIQHYENLDLLIVGKTQNGKSSTGNTILQKESFRVYGSTELGTTRTQFDSARYRNRNITVVDSIGFFQMHRDNYDNLLEFCQSMAEAMSIRGGKGYHAILIAVKYGNRLTQEQLDGIASVRKIFGRDVFRKYGIIILTYCDIYERYGNRDFRIWNQQQKGEFKDLLGDCDWRILRFDNATEDEAKKTTMRDELLKCVESLPSRGERYTNDLFKASAKERAKAIAGTVRWASLIAGGIAAAAAAVVGIFIVRFR